MNLFPFRGYCNELNTEGSDGGGGNVSEVTIDTATPVPSAEPAPQPSTLNAPDKAAPAVVAEFPEDWRDKLAGDDQKYRKQLERYASPQALAKAHKELQSKVSSGELLKAAKLPENPTAEELTAWRKDNNVPEKPADYMNDLPSGIIIGDEDKERVNSFIETMHGKNVAKDVVQAAIEWNQNKIEAERQEVYDRNSDLQEQTEEALRAEWGPEFKRNINLVNGVIATLPEAARDVFAGAKSLDGTALFNNPDIMRWMVDMARKVNPVGTVVTGATNISAVDSEIEQIEKVMKDNRSAYNKDAKMQERYMQLLEAKDRFNS
ncbi:hypothetical protein HL273_20370 [Yersinia enterocolitica]|uniref:hypothetical protein n=1 Tax=Yersinia enterocolitica TaxID=630 RepID=UPI00155B2204|nr:hypothetical protein [Yersinia enterocolitica]MBX9483883.1 hypothetical protein [Yersinia enterocolitica]NQS96539.1 hypothetical protein [Yersinia enterocolitica]NQT45626.1 hypothetical protein [Yersinia enterocolitica]NQU02347.1 hypothetical protein [Yersinia enterocolitica]HDM8447476.1 hypothetical protein [Yersinia enterocolitica]